jgi:hypothetical protein
VNIERLLRVFYVPTSRNHLMRVYGYLRAGIRHLWKISR